MSSALVLGMAGGASAQNISNMVAFVTTDDPQVQLMSIVLSVQAAQTGVGVRVLLCGDAGDLALKSPPESVTQPQPPLNVSSQAFMGILQQNDNVTIDVCALYLPGAGLSESDLIDGVGVVSPGDMAALLVAGDSRVLSF